MKLRHGWVLREIAVQYCDIGARAPSNCSHEAPVCTLGSAAVETAVDSTSRRDSSTCYVVGNRLAPRNPSSILSLHHLAARLVATLSGQETFIFSKRREGKKKALAELDTPANSS